ncbi:AAA family ATPase [Aeromicrobium sp. P5_D10]
MDVVIAAGDAAWEAEAIRELESSPSLRLVRRCVDVADLLAVARSERAAAAIVSVELAGLDVDTVHRLERSGVRVAAVQGDQARCDALGVTRRLRLGGLDEILRESPGPAKTAGEAAAPVVAVWGPAGAPGRSTVALALGSAAAGRGIDTILVDADTYGGALGQMLGMLDDVSGLVAACRAANQVRAHEVTDHLLDVDPGLRLLTGVPRADMWPQIRAGALDVVLTRLRTTADLIVVDCGFSLEEGAGPNGRNQTTLQLLDLAASVVAVGKPDPVGLSRLIRGLHDLGDVSGQREAIVVVNQMRSSLGWGEREVGSMLLRLTGHEPAVFLPFDQSGLDLAAVSGRCPQESASSSFVARMDVLTSRVIAGASHDAVLATVDQ